MGTGSSKDKMVTFMFTLKFIGAYPETMLGIYHYTNNHILSKHWIFWGSRGF